MRKLILVGALALVATSCAAIEPGGASEAQQAIIIGTEEAEAILEEGGPQAVDFGRQLIAALREGAENAGPNASWVQLALAVFLSLGSAKVLPDSWMSSPFGRPKPAGTES